MSVQVPVSIAIIGVGGGGVNALNTLYERKVPAFLLAVDTDRLTLTTVKGPNTICIGDKTTGGRGCGGDISLGEQSARESIENFMTLFRKKYDLVLFIHSLGGGTGAGSTPVLASELRAKYPDAIIGSVANLPFKSEGEERWETAKNGLNRILNVVDFVVLNLNDLLLVRFPSLSIREAFQRMDILVADAIHGLISALSPTGAIRHVDWADFKTAMRGAGVTALCYGEHLKLTRAMDLAIESPFLDATFEGAHSALLLVTARFRPPTKEVVSLLEKLRDYRIPRILWGVREDRSLRKNKIVLYVCGVKSRTVESLIGER